jgi:LCP family protein required for cell wall assembly
LQPIRLTLVKIGTGFGFPEAVLRKILWSIIAGLAVAVILIGFSFYGLGGGRMASPVAEMERFIPQLGNFSFGTLSQPTTILFMGTDVVYEKNGRQLKADRGALTGRSDTMMLVFLYPPFNRVSVLQIPRDTEAQIPGHGIQKINSANAIGGAELAKATVSSMLNVPIEHYVIMNIQGLVGLVNELGGITVEVPKRMNYMDWTGKLKIDLEPGWHTLTGNQAMGFVRFRHDDLGDIGRVQRQQIFLNAVCKKMVDPSSWLHVPALVGIAQQSIQTDLSEMDILSSLNFIHSVPRENIKFVMLPGQFSGNGDWIATWDAKTLAAHLLYPDQDIVSSRRNISICIQNASSDPNFGSKLAKSLRKLGYIVSVGKDQRDAIFKQTRIIAQDGNTANAKMLQQDLGNIGEIMNASIGNLTTSITVMAVDDINLDKIAMSSVDAPYVAPTPRQPLFPPIATRKTAKSADELNPADLDLPEKPTSELGSVEPATSSDPLSADNLKQSDESVVERQKWSEPAGAEPGQNAVDSSASQAQSENEEPQVSAKRPNYRALQSSDDSRAAYRNSESHASNGRSGADFTEQKTSQATASSAQNSESEPDMESSERNSNRAQ